MRNALAQSLNIPAVKTLYLVGVKNALKLAADMGLTTLNNPDRYGLTLVLGGGEVKLLDMTHAYGVFANKGIKAEPRTILRIEDNQGNIIEEIPVKEERILDENVTNMVSDILSDNVARAPLWGSSSKIHFPDRDVAAKSGSTNDFRDAWIMGYAPNIAVGAWCGNNDNGTMRGLSGLITTPMWREFMDLALSKLPEESFTQPYIPTDVKPVLAGYYPNPTAIPDASSTAPVVPFIDNYNSIHNILHYVDRNDPQGPAPTNPASDGQYAYWEYGVQAWKQAVYSAPLASSTLATTTEEEEEDDDRPRNRRSRR
jgi:membrane peptidoglycan carboxypeptidase